MHKIYPPPQICASRPPPPPRTWSLELTLNVHKSRLAVLIRNYAMRFRKRIINVNGLNRRYPSSVLCEQIRNFDREMKNCGGLKIGDFEILLFTNLDSRHYLMSLLQNSEEVIIIHNNGLTRGYAYLAYRVT